MINILTSATIHAARICGSYMLAAQALKVRVDALLGSTPKARARRGPASQLQRSIERIGELPKPKQRFVLEMLETVLAQASR